MKRDKLVQFFAAKHFVQGVAMRKAVLIGVTLWFLALIVAAITYSLGKELLNISDVFNSFLSSLVEDLIFFLIVGFGIMALSLRRPEDESFEARVRYLFHSKDLPSDYLNYAKKQIYRTAGMCSDAHKKLIVDGIDKRRGLYRVFFEHKFVVENVFETEQCEYNMVLFLRPDRGIKLSPVGQVMDCTVTQWDGVVKRYISQPISVSQDEYEQPVLVTIPPRKKIEIYWRAWMWMKIGDEHFTEMRRFVRNFRCTIENKLDEDIRIRSDSKGEQISSIKPGDELVLFEKSPMTPDDIHRFWWN